MPYTYLDTLRAEAEAFDLQIRERIDNGHIPDLRRAGRCEWFRNNVWRDQAYAGLLYGEITSQILNGLRSYAGQPPESIEVLEIACGPGHIALEVARHGYNVTGMDVSALCIQTAEETAADDPHQARRGELRYLVGDFLSMDHDRKYDMIYFSCALHHFGDLDATLDKVDDLLHEGGLIFASEPTRLRLKNHEAALFCLLRGLLSASGAYFEEVDLPVGEEGVQRAVDEVINEFDYKDEHGDNVQSPHDNEAGYEDMYPALMDRFEKLDFGFDFCFFDRLVGGLRLDTVERERAAAQWIHRLDQYIARSGGFTPEQFHFLGRKPAAV